MRGIIFRGLRKDGGGWIEGDLRQYVSGVVSIKNNNISMMFEVIPETVGQYTGLNDLNGKMIYKGDIVRCGYNTPDADGLYTIAEIVFGPGTFGICKLPELPFTYPHSCKNDNFMSLWEIWWNEEEWGNILSTVEVIGNRWDNPELMEGENNGRAGDET